MSQTFLQAIVKRFVDAAPELENWLQVGGGTGSPWTEEVPEGTQPVNYVEILHGGEEPDYTLADGELGYRMIDAEATFVVHQQGLQAAEALAQRILKVFDPIIEDWTLLRIAGAQVTGFFRTNYLVESEAQRAPDGNQIFKVTLPYEATLQQQLFRG